MHFHSFPGIGSVVLSTVFGCLGFSGCRLQSQSGAKTSSLDCRWEEQARALEEGLLVAAGIDLGDSHPAPQPGWQGHPQKLTVKALAKPGAHLGA